MDIMNFVEIGLVLGVVSFIQILKNVIETKRALTLKKPLSNDLWLLVVWTAGAIMALIINGINGFDDFNFFVYLKDVFIYAAAASFTYKNYDKGKALIGGK